MLAIKINDLTKRGFRVEFNYDRVGAYPCLLVSLYLDLSDRQKYIKRVVLESDITKAFHPDAFIEATLDKMEKDLAEDNLRT